MKTKLATTPVVCEERRPPGTTRRWALAGLAASLVSIAVANPAEAKKPYHNQGRRNPHAMCPPIGKGDHTPILLNPNTENIQDMHRNSRFTFSNGDWVECEKPVRLAHTTCEADIPGGAHVTWPNLT